MMAMGISESPIAGDQRRRKALGECDVHAIGHGMGITQLVSALDECLCRPTPNGQALEVGNGDEPFMIADQPADDRSAYRSTILPARGD
jgi:hypothetical protein